MKKNINEKEKKEFIRRLNIINGQISGIEKMIINDREYEDILIQISAVTKSLQDVGNKVYMNYVNNNISDELKGEIKELINLYKKLV